MIWNYINVRINANETSQKVSILDRVLINVKSLSSHFNRTKKIQAQIAAYKTTKECYIIGNGPSINRLKWSIINEFDTFGVNAVYLLQPEIKKIPTYYVIEDVYVAEDRKDEIMNFKRGEIEIYPNYLKYLFKGKSNALFVNVFFYYGRLFKPRVGKSIDHGLFVGGSVSHLCIQLAIHLGYKKIHIVGMDHNYVVHDTVKSTGVKIFSTKDDDPNHFSPKYFGKGKRWHEPNMERMERTHDYLNTVARKKNVVIYNCFEGSGLKSYPICDLHDVYLK